MKALTHKTRDLLQTSVLLGNEEGKIGYLFAWLLGVPVSFLLIIFLIRGH